MFVFWCGGMKKTHTKKNKIPISGDAIICMESKRSRMSKMKERAEINREMNAMAHKQIYSNQKQNSKNKRDSTTRRKYRRWKIFNTSLFVFLCLHQQILSWIQHDFLHFFLFFFFQQKIITRILNFSNFKHRGKYNKNQIKSFN